MTEFDGKLKELSKLIRSWNLFSDTSKSQIDDFSKKLLTALDNEANTEKIKRIIESELCIIFGFFNREFDAHVLSNQIMLWWDK
jgi:hypothetical protein